MQPGTSASLPENAAALPLDEMFATCSFAQPVAGCAVVRITGELDACSVPPLETQIAAGLDPECLRLVVDLRDVGFIDSTGIRLLVQLMNSGGTKRDLVIVRPSSLTARRAIEVVGLPRIITVVDGVEEAIGGGC